MNIETLDPRSSIYCDYALLFFAFRPPGMLVAEIYIPFLAVTLYSKSLILLHDYQQ